MNLNNVLYCDQSTNRIVYCIHLRRLTTTNCELNTQYSVNTRVIYPAAGIWYSTRNDNYADSTTWWCDDAQLPLLWLTPSCITSPFISNSNRYATFVADDIHQKCVAPSSKYPKQTLLAKWWDRAATAVAISVMTATALQSFTSLQPELVFCQQHLLGTQCIIMRMTMPGVPKCNPAQTIYLFIRDTHPFA